MKNKYRVVKDNFSGYEVQIKYWYLPIFWFQVGGMAGVNTHNTIQKATDFAQWHAKERGCVKYLGKL